MSAHPPPDDEAPLAEDRQRSLTLLHRSLTAHRGRWALYFLKYTDARDQLSVAELLARFFTRPLRLDVHEGRFAGWPALQSHFTSLDAAIDAVELVGLDAWLTPQRARQWNLLRDAFIGRLRCPLLIWTTPAPLAMLAGEAPDLWDWRTAVFDFRLPEEAALTLAPYPHPDPR